MLYQLSHKATHWERGQLVEFISPVRSEMMCSIYEINHVCTAVVGESKEALIFQDSSFQLLKLEIYCNDHSILSYSTAVQK